MKRNSEQPSLFGPVDQYGGINPPMARTTDPESSHRAAE